MTQAMRNRIAEGIVVFDIDGVLASYEFTPACHSADIWDEAFISVDDNPYCQVGPLPVLQDYIKAMPIENVYVCSVAGDYEQAAKKAFVLRHYDVLEDHILMVPSKDKKLEVLQDLEKQCPGVSIAIVDDTVKTLDAIHGASDYITVHITSFFD